METLLEKLGRLSQQRTVRTDRLEAAIHQLCAELDKVTEPGDRSADGALKREMIHTNVAATSLWFFRGRALEKPIGAMSYVHGDFNNPVHGPSRDQAIEFAGRATELVNSLVERVQAQVDALERTESELDAALKTVRAAI